MHTGIYFNGEDVNRFSFVRSILITFGKHVSIPEGTFIHFLFSSNTLIFPQNSWLKDNPHSYIEFKHFL